MKHATDLTDHNSTLAFENHCGISDLCRVVTKSKKHRGDFQFYQNLTFFGWEFT